jgi:hypothetical protein
LLGNTIFCEALLRTYNLIKSGDFPRILTGGKYCLRCGSFLCDSSGQPLPIGVWNVPKTGKSAKRGKAPFNKDKRRRHHHFLVTISYADGEKFGRVYTDKEKASRFADRQRRSPVVKAVNVAKVS